MSTNGDDVVPAQPPEMSEDTDTEEEVSVSSFSSEESDEENSGQAQPERWTEAGTQPTFPFTNVGHFNLGPAESPIEVFDIIFNTFIKLLVISINAQGYRSLLENDNPSSRLALWKDTDADEIRTFLALLFHMGHIEMDRINDYWSTCPLLDLPFKNFMSRDRFLLILRNLRFFDSESYCKNDPNRYIKPIINFFNSHMKSLVSPTKQLNIDESVILSRDRSRSSELAKNKRYKHGLKMYVLTDTTGITQKMFLYSGSHDTELKGKGHSEKVAMSLMNEYLNAGYSLYTDEYFSSVTLAEKLLDKRTYLTGKLRAERFRNPTITRSKLAKGTSLTRYNARGVCVTNYKGKKNVLMISTEHSSSFVNSKNRHGHITQEPKVILEFNKHMKGVYKKEQMLSYYPIYNKCKTWYKKIILHVIHVMLLNCFIMYNVQLKRSGGKVMSFLDFRLNLVKTLLKPDTSTDRLTDSSTGNNIMTTSTSEIIHVPERLPTNNKGETKRKSCRHCLDTRNIRKATAYYCPQCNKKPGLCIKCFRDYHNY